MQPRSSLLFSADDRTGALEVAGLVADLGHAASVQTSMTDAKDEVVVLDTGTRHVAPATARARLQRMLGAPHPFKAHKMDAGLRGNWAHEVGAILAAGHRVAILCAFPAAGRVCVDGTVFIHGAAVLDSVFGADPRSAPVSSMPSEVLRAAGVEGDVRVFDAATDAELERAVRSILAEERFLVGAAGALGEYARQLLGEAQAPQFSLPKPWLIVCGSLNPRSRAQIDALDHPIGSLTEASRLGESLTVLATPDRAGAISTVEADEMARSVADAVRQIYPRSGTLILIGGDTVAAVVGDEPLEVCGTIAPGVPVSRYGEGWLVTKGGGIGEVDLLKALAIQYEVVK